MSEQLPEEELFLEGDLAAQIAVYEHGLDVLEFILFKPGQNKTFLRKVIRSIREKAMYERWPNLKTALENLSRTSTSDAELHTATAPREGE